GVDVFFVISGYLITGLILRAEAGAGFSLTNFYDRRIRRILPALFAMLIAASVAAFFVLLPDELEQFAKSLVAGVLFYANILYWLRDTAYFAPDAGQNPLLHVWSLSVEEQFYLLWPLALVALSRYRRALPIAIGMLAIASLAFALTIGDPNVAFYLLPSRAWQLLIGAFLAVGTLTPPKSVPVRNAVALAGFALIAAAMLWPSGPALYHPRNSLGAAFGAALFLFAADGGDNVVSALLATRVPVFIGVISYSLYLWHWPALVFARLYLNRDLTPGETASILAAVFAISMLSWRYIEQPIRLGRGARASFPAAAVGGAVLLGVAALFALSAGLPGRLPPDVRAIAAQAAAPMRGQWCNARQDCVSGDPALPGEAVLWGDSHARALVPGLEAFAAARHLRLRQLSRGGCPPLPGLDVTAPDAGPFARCAHDGRDALDRILHTPDVKLVILEARWEVYFNEHRIHPDATAAQAFTAALASLLDTLAAHRIAVLVIGNVPIFPDVAAHCYGRERMFGRDPAKCLGQSRAGALALLSQSETLIAQTAAAHHARYHAATADLCDGTVCHAFWGGQLLYLDNHHLTPAGAALVGQGLMRQLGPK
ncbi:MAG TPA: acyltransferase family protein, partial [Rhizomicrobium sp.]|nr:acyltransferase family protein [Rhizomicrobium sp.]